MPTASGFSTLAIHAGAPDPARKARETPGHQTAGLAFDDGEHAASLYGLQTFGNIFSRFANPTNGVLEERIAALEGGSAALAVASGHAARLLVFQALLQPGDEFVASRRLCGGSINQFNHAFKSFGWTVRWAGSDEPESFVDALSDRTKAIFIESIADPGGYVTDIEAIANAARRARVPLIVDNTLATPYLLRPIEHGADVVVHSAPRFLGGPGTSIAGLIVDGGTFDWLKDERFPLLSKASPSYDGVVIAETFGNFAFAIACRALGLRDLGPALSPFDAFLILNGIETLPLRMQRHCENALAVARHLSRHPAVEWVHYAGLESDRGFATARHYCPRGAGAVFTFGINGGYDAGVALVERLKLFSHLSNVGDTRSLVVHPASNAPRKLDDDPRLASGAAANVVRLSIGLEDVVDIIADLDQALAARVASR